jgi:flagella basal body P-ring formation protein FlgA
MNRNGELETTQSLIALLLFAALATVAVADAALEIPALELPPPPVVETIGNDPVSPPAVDMTLIAALRAVPFEGASFDVAPDRNVAAAMPMVLGILDDIGSRSDGQQMLETMLFDQLREALPGSESCLLEQPTLPAYLALPSGGFDAKFHFRLPGAGIGRATYSAALTDPRTGDQQRFSGTVVIDREASGVTVTRLVRRDETIGPDDVQVLTARLSRLPRGTLDAADQAVGTKARKELRPGEWLTEQSVTTPDLVRRGQAVTMRLNRGPLTVTAPGIVQQRGARGELVRVQNAESGKDIFARVVSGDEVEVVN